MAYVGRKPGTKAARVWLPPPWLLDLMMEIGAPEVPDIFDTGGKATAVAILALPADHLAFALVPDATETVWFQELGKAGDEGRIAFQDDTGSAIKGNPRGSNLLLFNANEEVTSRFHQLLAPRGL